MSQEEAIAEIRAKENKALAKAIVAKLEKKKALRKSLPFYLDRDKFRHCLERDVLEVLEAERRGE